MKKFLGAILSLTMVLAMISTAFATEASSPDLTPLANEYITISEANNETVYSNIQEFYSAARTEFPSVSDLNLAKAVMDCTNQDYSNLSDGIILEALDFTEITSVDQVFRTKEDGSVEELSVEEAHVILDNPVAPVADWESDDGYMQMTTTSSAGSKGSYGTPFTLACTATWLKYPVNRFTDTLAIVYGGTFDDSYTIYSSFKEEGKCTLCSNTFYWNEVERYGKETGNNTPHFIENSDMIELDFAQSQAIGAKHDIKLTNCIHNTMGSSVNFGVTTRMESYIRFRILCSSTTEARSAYAHTKLGGSISISGSVSGTGVSPSFSGALSIIAAKYTAAPVTLRCN